MKKVLQKSSIPVLLTASFLFAPAVQAQTPYYGKEYSQPEQVRPLFPEVEVTDGTPAFVKGEEAFTTQEEMLAYIEELKGKSPYLTVKNIGASQNGLEIPALYFTKDQKINPSFMSRKPTVWIQSQIHGNEPASGESVLAIANRLTGELGEEVLDKINVIVVPRVNPDGSYNFKRQLQNGLDGNRDHVKLESPEVQAIHHEYNRYTPEVVIDAHEYSPYTSSFDQFGDEGLLKYHDILLLSGRNLNIPEKIRTMSDSLYVDPTLDTLEQNGFTGDRYYTTGVTNGEIDILEGGTEPRIGRNAFGLQTAFSFLVESRGIAIGREDFGRRVAAQIATHENILRQTAANAKKVKTTVAAERAKLIKKGLVSNDKDPIFVNSEAAEIENQTLEMVDIATGTLKDVPVNYFSATEAKPTLTRERPTAYVLNPDQSEVAAKLQNQGLKGFKLPKQMKLSVEAYDVTSKENTEKYEGKQLVEVKTELERKDVLFPKGTYVFLSAQPQNNLLSLSLEPESIDSYVTFGFIPSEVGQELPVYRFMFDGKKLK
ncbi:M14 family metallopeptidase [Bacillus sp. UMB0893]|uniref:M14 family metallopeptidase n=1 Tax=Bacillus sp. UMB0893 TaxID=2066053 RepID=UPI000C757ED0|nr:M14 family metallopeptidase [Bacillus sp. UMB0893]PLR69270.1 peptidase M14 [Bacillus sp. UMB0893]